jgi:hypothetical protein
MASKANVIDALEKEAFIAQLKEFDTFLKDVDEIELDKIELDFYKDISFYRVFVKEISTNPYSYFIAPKNDPSQISILSKSPTNIIKTNKLYGIDLNPSNIVSYMNFFLYCNCEAGDAFRIIRSKEELESLLIGEYNANLVEKAISLSPITVVPNEKGFILTGIILEGGNLSKTQIQVFNDGRFQLLQDALIIENLTVSLSFEQIGELFL